jgi:hypothetical protein
LPLVEASGEDALSNTSRLDFRMEYATGESLELEVTEETEQEPENGRAERAGTRKRRRTTLRKNRRGNTGEREQERKDRTTGIRTEEGQDTRRKPPKMKT